MTNFSDQVVRSIAHGRAEIAGNHTDHQGGKVVAATIDCATTMLVRPAERGRASVASVGYEPFEIDVFDTAPVASERNTTRGLVRGMVGTLRNAGVDVDGFDVTVVQSVPAGSGLSSSAAFELALGQALNLIFAEGRASAQVVAKAAQAAEREWFGKSCGLMDQLSIALGGVQVMDFRHGGCKTEKLDVNFEALGLAMVMIDVRCDHSAYGSEYDRVAQDMRIVAEHLGVSELADFDSGSYLEALAEVRAQLGDMRALRGLHFFNESALVESRIDALARMHAEEFLAATRMSGASSAQYLQNVSPIGAVNQPAMVALAVAEHILGGRGAVRIHGGGFGGTVQAFVPVAQCNDFMQAVDAVLGIGSCARYAVIDEPAFAQRV